MYVAKETGRNKTALAGQPVRRGPAPTFVDPPLTPPGGVLGCRDFLREQGSHRFLTPLTGSNDEATPAESRDRMRAT